ncbi:ROK family protein [Microbacterium aerolatum]|uniref:Glucokinase n=1 Tax=Microbacterium aerolatum TaxID=153731 RepID=A0A511AI43_9MICO|nr:ROK family protein [Microbacterium aerolatum]GEK87706.1 glucokinase [Microbacterium aerolatum]GGB33950.1 glucokinase [Microbacterium aerolatum]
MELCIDFGGTEIKLAVIDDGGILGTAGVPVSGDARDLIAARTAARELVARTGASPTAVGIAVPGVVDPASGQMLHANDKYDFLRGFDLHTWAREQLGLPAAVENDARAALIGETSTGSAAGERDAVLVTLGTGIGTAAMIDGVGLRGRTGHAGILGGHVTVDIHGPACPCGNVGCGEALASAWALSSAGQSTIREGLSVKDLFRSDDHTEIREGFLDVWGATVVTLIHMYDPSVVILSGGVLRAGDAVRAPIETYVREHLWSSVTAPRFIVPPEPEYSVARGLSTLARNAPPQTPEEQETH